MGAMKFNRLSWLASIMLFLLIPPYFMWGMFSDNAIKIFFSVFFCGIFFIYKESENDKNQGLKALFIFTLLYYIFGGIINGQSNVFGVCARMMMLLYVFIPFAKKEFAVSVYNKFLTIYAIVISISLLSYIGAQLGYLHPIGNLVVGQHNRAYTIYPLLVLDSDFDFLRFYGPFNEPGVVGTLAAVLLCTQKFNFKDWRTSVILVSGMLSMSLFFFGLVVCYGFIYIVFVKRRFVVALLFVGLFAGFYMQTKDDTILYNTLWQRFEWDETEHQFKGDNRKNEAVDKFYDELKTKPSFWFGSSQSEVERFWRLVEETSSYKVIVLNSGMLFLFLYLLFFVILARRYADNNLRLALFVLVLLANTYQRPDVYSELMLFLYSYFGRYSLSNDRENEILT